MWSEAVAVHPWIGNRYPTPRHLKYRTLVLGESNFTSPDVFTPSLVRNCVEDDMRPGGEADRDTLGFCRFSTKLRRIVLGGAEKGGPSGFWPDVAFYNYVQMLVGDQARMRPTEEMWKSGEAAFKEVITKLRPERILVLGKATWSNLLRIVQHQPVDAHSAHIEVGAGAVLAGYIHHPSSSLRYEDWQPVAQKLLLR